MKHIHVLTVLFCLGCSGVFAQQDALPHTHEILVQLAPGADSQRFLAALSANNRTKTPMFELKKAIAPDWNIYLLEVLPSDGDQQAPLEALLRVPEVRIAQWNHTIDYRDTEPNDANWPNQTDLNLIGMQQAWDLSTGGLHLRAGATHPDTIVVAILEKGAYMDHPDLVANRWYNRGEIPNDGIDNDGNGYVDDFRGWNPRFNNDSPGDIGNHGTAVNAIIGAHGNNDIGVTGVNWNVKLLNLSNIEQESEIVAAYYYIVKMRRLYNQTNGAKGAFVVSTNASFGLDKAKAVNFPLWCAAYDSLGAVGVLTAASTTNMALDVDVVGDMPTTCTSTYLITTTNVDITDQKVVGAGYGLKSIDMGAPGSGTFTATYSGGTAATYGTFGGTSASAPHISGSIALLYSTECESVTADALTDPAACARRIRDLILDNVSPNPTLDNVTMTGGRLNMAGAVDAVRTMCNGTVGPLNLLSLTPNPVETILTVTYETPDFAPCTFRFYNMLGQLMYEETTVPPKFGAKEFRFDASPLPTGVYIASLQRGSAVKSIKFVKKYY